MGGPRRDLSCPARFDDERPIETEVPRLEVSLHVVYSVNSLSILYHALRTCICTAVPWPELCLHVVSSVQGGVLVLRRFVQHRLNDSTGSSAAQAPSVLFGRTLAGRRCRE